MKTRPRHQRRHHQNGHLFPPPKRKLSRQTGSPSAEDDGPPQHNRKSSTVSELSSSYHLPATYLTSPSSYLPRYPSPQLATSAAPIPIAFPPGSHPTGAYPTYPAIYLRRWEPELQRRQRAPSAPTVVAASDTSGCSLDMAETAKSSPALSTRFRASPPLSPQVRVRSPPPPNSSPPTSVRSVASATAVLPELLQPPGRLFSLTAALSEPHLPAASSSAATGLNSNVKPEMGAHALSRPDRDRGNAGRSRLKRTDEASRGPAVLSAVGLHILEPTATIDARLSSSILEYKDGRGIQYSVDLSLPAASTASSASSLSSRSPSSRLVAATLAMPSKSPAAPRLSSSSCATSSDSSLPPTPGGGRSLAATPPVGSLRLHSPSSSFFEIPKDPRSPYAFTTNNNNSSLPSLRKQYCSKLCCIVLLFSGVAVGGLIALLVYLDCTTMVMKHGMP